MMELFCKKKKYAKRLSSIFERVLSTLLHCTFSSVTLNPLCQPHKMVKHTQTIRLLLPTNCLSVFYYFVGLPLQGSNVCPDFRIYPDFLGKESFGCFQHPVKASGHAFEFQRRSNFRKRNAASRMDDKMQSCS